MTDTTSLGDRMKDYEVVPGHRLMRRQPVLMRLDGRAFHTLTRKMDRPMDSGMVDCMTATAKRLCEEIDGARIAYVQSDEISILLIDYERLNTQPWFDDKVQKMCSVAAGIASAVFTTEMRSVFVGDVVPPTATAIFDCRVWNLPRAEVVNYFVWRQQDATRNSIQSLAQSHFSHKELLNKNQPAMQDMLVLQKSINWNNCPTIQKRGWCVTRELYENEEGVTRSRWTADANIPIFTQDRDYIGRFVDVDS